MAEEPITTIIDYEVAPCPRCDKPHTFKLKGLARRKEEEVPLFGGTGDAGRGSEVLFTCPETGKKFTRQVAGPASTEIAGLASEADVAAAAQAASPPPPQAKGEFEEWAKKSRDIAADFCKTMLSASTGGIPVYFAVLKYIGFEKIGGTALSKFAVLPPVLFLVAAVLFATALRPRHESVAPKDFGDFRRRRLEQLNRFIIAATAFFVGAVGLAIVVLFYTLTK